MQTLSYGYKKPDSIDKGDTVFPALETNIQMLNDHTHDGSNSALLATQTVSVSASGWSAVGTSGLYRKTVTVPTGLNYDTCDVWVKRSTGERCYPTLERISSTQFYIYTNDSSLAYTCYFR
jgi:hypothetical protein